MSATAMADTEVNFHFDQKRGDKSVTMRLGALNKRNVAAAAAAVDSALGSAEPSVTRTASILHTLAANADNVDSEDTRFIEEQPPASPLPPVTVRPRIQAARPLAAFKAAAAKAELSPTSIPEATALNGAGRNSISPEVEVKIEIEGAGVFTSHYHQVIELPNVLVLVWDTRYRGTRFMPPDGENVPKMAIQRAGSSRIFLVHPTSINIPFQNYELSVLLIEDVGEQQEET